MQFKLVASAACRDLGPHWMTASSSLPGRLQAIWQMLRRFMIGKGLGHRNEVGRPCTEGRIHYKSRTHVPAAMCVNQRHRKCIRTAWKHGFKQKANFLTNACEVVMKHIIMVHGTSQASSTFPLYASTQGLVWNSQCQFPSGAEAPANQNCDLQFSQFFESRLRLGATLTRSCYGA